MVATFALGAASQCNPVIHKRPWVIVDGDDAGKKVIAGLTNKYKDWTSDHFMTWDQPDFEGYCPPSFDK